MGMRESQSQFAASGAPMQPAIAPAQVAMPPQMKQENEYEMPMFSEAMSDREKNQFITEQLKRVNTTTYTMSFLVSHRIPASLDTDEMKFPFDSQAIESFKSLVSQSGRKMELKEVGDSWVELHPRFDNVCLASATLKNVYSEYPVPLCVKIEGMNPSQMIKHVNGTPVAGYIRPSSSQGEDCVKLYDATKLFQDERFARYGGFSVDDMNDIACPLQHQDLTRSVPRASPVGALIAHNIALNRFTASGYPFNGTTYTVSDNDFRQYRQGLMDTVYDHVTRFNLNDLSIAFGRVDGTTLGDMNGTKYQDMQDSIHNKEYSVTATLDLEIVVPGTKKESRPLSTVKSFLEERSRGYRIPPSNT